MAHTNQVKVLPRSDVVEATLTRPANATPYTAGDVVSNSAGSGDPMELTGCAGVNGGSGAILAATLISSASPATAPDLEAWIFDTEPAEKADNAEWAPTDAESATLVGIIRFQTGDARQGGDAANSATNTVWFTEVRIPFVCESGSRSLWAHIVTRNGFTPASGQTLKLRLGLLQD